MIAGLVGKGAQALVGALFVVAATIAGWFIGSIGFQIVLGVLGGAGVPGTAGLVSTAPIVGFVTALGFAYKAGG